MDFAFSPEQEDLRRHVSELLDAVCPPQYAERCDREATPPREAYRALAEHGWFGIAIPREYGGSGASPIELAIVLEEAGMLTAQIVRFPDQPDREPVRMGLNTTGHDDQQFVLNLMHWLSRLLP